MPPKAKPSEPKKAKKKQPQKANVGTKPNGKAKAKAKGGIAQNIHAHRSMLRAITKSTIVKNNVALNNSAGGGAGGSNYLTYGQPNQQPAANATQPMTFNINMAKEAEPAAAAAAKPLRQPDRMDVDPPPKPARATKGTQSNVFIKPERATTGTQSNVFIKPERATTGTQSTAPTRRPMSMSESFHVASLNPDAADISDARPPKRAADPAEARRIVRATRAPEQPQGPLFAFGRKQNRPKPGTETTSWRAYRHDLNRDLMSRPKEWMDPDL
jgi:hypothetical protein